MSFGYKTYIKKWDLYYRNHTAGMVPWGGLTPDRHIIDFINFYNFSKKTIILDAGCGHGKNSQFLIKKGYAVYGLDISQYVIEHCKNRHPEGKFKVGNVQNIKFQNSFFDVIIDAGCFHVNPPWSRKIIIKEYRRVLKENGKMFVRLFRRKDNQYFDMPIFCVDDLPVYGFLRNEIPYIFRKKFIIEKTIFERNYGVDGVFYIYLKKK